MPNVVLLYDLLISCPGDIKDEIRIIDECVEEFNEHFSKTLGITIRTRNWKKSSYPQSGGKPQQLLNEQLVNDCDAVVALLWTRFGTPTDNYGSGTEEEIEVMLDKGKQVFMYFSDKQMCPSDVVPEQYQKVKEFKSRYASEGLYYTYSSNEEFRQLFYAHLTRYFLTMERVNEIQDKYCPSLRIVGIDNRQQIQEKAPILDFTFSYAKTAEQFIVEIKELYKDISSIHIEQQQQIAPDFGLNLQTPVVIEKGIQDCITEMAEAIDISLTDDFFLLGSLQKDSPSLRMLDIGGDLYGTIDEKRKYHSIIELHKKIIDLCDWTPIERAFSGKKCLMFALQNCGTAVDEDVEISLSIPNNCYESVDEFSTFESDEIFYLLNERDVEDLFSIHSSSLYTNYHESITTPLEIGNYSTDSPYIEYSENYSDDLYDELLSVFCYSAYKEGDNVIVKLKMEYIKHNTTIAFPTPLFIKGNPGKISYKITSKYLPEIVMGEIETVE